MSNLNLIKPQGVQNIINKFCMTIGMIPSSYKLSLTYEEQILAIGHYLDETVIPALNNNAEAVAELQALFIQLKDYVENYFDNLDVQSEIDKKLDKMAEDGTLQNIINQEIFGELNNKINTLNSKITQYDIIVAQDSSGDFTSLTQAVENAVSGNKIFVKSGTYENEVVKAKDKFLYIEGDSIKKPIIRNTLNDYYNPPLEIAKGVVNNIIFKQEGVQNNYPYNAYAIHIDWDTQTENLTFNNCEFWSTKSASVGVGLRPNYLLMFNKCDFFSTNEDNMGALFVHNSNNPAMLGPDQYIQLNECYLYANKGCAIHMQSCYGANNVAYLIAHNTCLNSFTNHQTDLIRRTLYETATSHTMLLADYNNGNTPILNSSSYEVNNPLLIDKFLNSQLNYPILRVIKTLEINTPQVDHAISYDEIDERFGGIVNIYGMYTEKVNGEPTGLILPLNFNSEKLDLWFRCYINDTTRSLVFNTSAPGTLQIVIEYWQKYDNL